MVLWLFTLFAVYSHHSGFIDDFWHHCECVVCAEGRRAFDDMVATIVTGLDATYGEDPKVGYERYKPIDKAWELFGKYAQEFWW